MTISCKSHQPLSAKYEREIGGVVFRISSFGNPNASQSAEEMLLSIMEREVVTKEPSYTKEDNV